MIRLRRIRFKTIAKLALICGLSTSSLAVAGDEEQIAGWCSTTTSAGIWAVSWGYGTPQQHCQRNANGLQGMVPGAFMTSTWGTFNIYTTNQVSVNCAGAWNNFSGFGENPLQWAYDWAWSIGAQNCRFTVFP